MSQKNIKVFSSIAIILFIALEFWGMETLDALSYAAAGAALADYCYDRFLWRYNPWEPTPRLYGSYNANGVSSHNGETTYQSCVIITQRLSSISVLEILNDACCESVTANLTRHTPDGPWFLYYTYLTHPNHSDTDDMHYGTAIFQVREGGILTGNYFTNRLKQTAGNMTLQRIKR
ncbi:MAG: hypothetical protein IJN67_11810 [Oscillospiraceae bacterium]|nr:hypothetical protein [Oscillospiraceae bacterium]